LCFSKEKGAYRYGHIDIATEEVAMKRSSAARALPLARPFCKSSGASGIPFDADKTQKDRKDLVMS
jgi:hypothetical protein